jgi:hypothetical protein
VKAEPSWGATPVERVSCAACGREGEARERRSRKNVGRLRKWCTASTRPEAEDYTCTARRSSARHKNLSCARHATGCRGWSQLAVGGGRRRREFLESCGSRAIERPRSTRRRISWRACCKQRTVPFHGRIGAEFFNASR